MFLRIEEKGAFCFGEVLSVECTGRQRGCNHTINGQMGNEKKNMKSCIMAVVVGAVI